MNAVSFALDSVAAGIETWLCYFFCSIFLDIDFFKNNKYKFLIPVVFSVLFVEAGDILFSFSLGRSMLYSTFVFYIFQVILYKKYYLKCAVMSLFYMMMLAMSDFTILVVCSLTSKKPFNAFLAISVYRVIALIIHILVLSFIIYLIYHIKKKYISDGKTLCNISIDADNINFGYNVTYISVFFINGTYQSHRFFCLGNVGCTVFNFFFLYRPSGPDLHSFAGKYAFKYA